MAGSSDLRVALGRELNSKVGMTAVSESKFLPGPLRAERVSKDAVDGREVGVGWEI